MMFMGMAPLGALLSRRARRSHRRAVDGGYRRRRSRCSARGCSRAIAENSRRGAPTDRRAGHRRRGARAGAGSVTTRTRSIAGYSGGLRGRVLVYLRAHRKQFASNEIEVSPMSIFRHLHRRKRIPGRATRKGRCVTPRVFRDAPPPDISAKFREACVFSRSASEPISASRTQATDGLADAIVAAIEGGFNVVDSAINYRLQRSERSIGKALQELAAKGIPARAKSFCARKAGFLTPDGEMPDDPNEYFSSEFIERGVFRPEDIAAGCHCMTPRLSRRPARSQPAESGRRLRRRFLPAQSGNAAQRKLLPMDNYAPDLATRSRFSNRRSRAEKSPRTASLRGTHFARNRSRRVIFRSRECAKNRARNGGARPSFPFRAAAAESRDAGGAHRPNQMVAGKTLADGAGGAAAGDHADVERGAAPGPAHAKLPPYIARRAGAEEELSAALQFVRSVPGVTTALVGMSRSNMSEPISRSSASSLPPRSVLEAVRVAQLKSRRRVAVAVFSAHSASPR